jgi:hypothetical protein
MYARMQSCNSAEEVVGRVIYEAERDDINGDFSRWKAYWSTDTLIGWAMDREDN